MNISTAPVASFLCIGKEWFPTTPGGLNRYVYELTQHLIATGDQVELRGVGLPETDPNSSILLTNLASPKSPLLLRLWNTRQCFQQQPLSQPHAINLHFALYSFPILNRLPQRVPITFTFHGPWAAESLQEGQSSNSTAFKRWIEQRVYQRCDRFIVLSKAFGTILHEDYHIPWEKIHIIAGGVDTTRFQPSLSRQAAREKLDFPLDRPILFTPRRLVHRMGIDKLLLALAQVKQQVPNIWLAIAGKGPLRESLEHQVSELALQNHVRFLGYVPDEQLPIAYQAADLTVVPSQALEGFGLILLESLACGTPVLSTPIGGMPEVLRPFHPELVTESPDPAAIADRLIDFFTGNLSLPKRQDCREYAVRHYDWQIIAPQVRDILLQPLSHSP